MSEYRRKDHYYTRAKDEGFRSRAAYKLIEIDTKYRLLRPGRAVVDLGCYPGGWLQVASRKVGSSGTVVGVDLVEVEQIPGVELLQGDFMQAHIQEELCRQVGRKIDVILSDMSPKLTGIRFRDAAFSAELVEETFQFAKQVLKKEGAVIAKIFPGEEAEEVFQRYRNSFRRFSRPRLKATRGSSSEMYFVAEGFCG